MLDYLVFDELIVKRMYEVLTCFLQTMFQFMTDTYMQVSVSLPMRYGTIGSGSSGSHSDEDSWLIIAFIFLVIIAIFYYLKGKEIKPTKHIKKRSKFKD